MIELRDALRTIDLDNNHKVCFIEYCLFEYKKNLRQLFEIKKGEIAELVEVFFYIFSHCRVETTVPATYNHAVKTFPYSKTWKIHSPF